MTDELPPPNTKRWVPRRKAMIVTAVRRGAVSLEEVCRRFELTVEEFLSWQRTMETGGVARAKTIVSRPKSQPKSTRSTIRPGKLAGNLDSRVVVSVNDQPQASPEAHGANYTVAGTRAAEYDPPRPQGAPRRYQIEHHPSVSDHPIGLRRGSRNGFVAKPTSGSSPVEMWFEDAVTTDGGPLRVPRPDRAGSLYGCATARCQD